MAYDLEEQESLAEIKAWWEKWGNLILTVVTVACLCAAGFQGWRWYQMKESTDAGVLYAQMIQASNMKDEARVQAIAGRLHESYASTTYAGMGALKWIVDSDKYPELKPLASVRLAGVYLDEGKYDQGLTVLNAVKDAKGEEVPVYDRMGDLYLAKGDVAAARKSWEDALRHAPMTNPLVGVIEIKLNSLPKE